jgi:hypothetical protein
MDESFIDLIARVHRPTGLKSPAAAFGIVEASAE